MSRLQQIFLASLMAIGFASAGFAHDVGLRAMCGCSPPAEKPSPTHPTTYRRVPR
ncbi:hypothetical protein [Egbenema bharatensis]|uniref:hypothetical protein n=1 Tax=Egbenema bharatensis TaxID=3463334 RepID=UPI003A8AFFBD